MDHTHRPLTLVNQASMSAREPVAGVADLPEEVAVRIGMHLSDLGSFSAFTQVCRHTARLSRNPTYTGIMADLFVDAKCAASSQVYFNERPAHVYRSACKLGSRMQLAHLERMMDCLAPLPEEEQLARFDHQFAAFQDQSANDEDVVASCANRRRVAVAAAISARGIEYADKAVADHTLRLVESIDWTHRLRPLGTILFAEDGDNDIALISDACIGIWKWVCSDRSSVSEEKRHVVASYLLSMVRSLPVEAKIPLLRSIVGWAISTRSPHGDQVLPEMQRFADNAEKLDIDVADQFFGILRMVLGKFTTDQHALPGHHLRFARMLPVRPWRENSKPAVAWLVAALVHNAKKLEPELLGAFFHLGGLSGKDAEYLQQQFGRMSAPQIKAAIPRGIFSSKEIAYLLASTSDGSFRWEDFEKVQPPGSETSDKCAIS